jgi:hypothetical protein
VASKIFISFAQADDAKRRLLCRVLQEQEPTFEPIVVTSRRSPGKPLTDKVTEGIKEAEHFVVLLTRESIANQWVNQEIGFAVGIGKSPLAVADRALIGELKGFIHSQQDLPFHFAADGTQRSTSLAFRRACEQLREHLVATSAIKLFQSRISPPNVQAGSAYTTSVEFKGLVRHGFFDNRVIHLGSDFNKWNPDPGTLPRRPGLRSSHTPGLLDGIVEVRREYSHSTRGWPKGRYKIYVRLYSHIEPGRKGRQKIAENEHELVVE